MTSATETALLALTAALAAKAAEADSPLPAPSRNENLNVRLAVDGDGSGIERFLNIIDGDRADPDELLGADLGGAEFYDITWRARVEFAVAGGDSAAREAAFDAMRGAIWDAIKPAVAAGSVTYLGGAVSCVRIVDMLPVDQSNPARAGLPNVKASDFVVELTYISARPF